MTIGKTHKTFFILLIFFSLYHLIRDLLQNYQVENLVTAFLKTNKNWCTPYCNVITIPFELFIMAGALVVVKRSKIGILGKLVIAVFLTWALMFLYDYFIYN